MVVGVACRLHICLEPLRSIGVDGQRVVPSALRVMRSGVVAAIRGDLRTVSDAISARAESYLQASRQNGPIPEALRVFSSGLVEQLPGIRWENAKVDPSRRLIAAARPSETGFFSSVAIANQMLEQARKRRKPAPDGGGGCAGRSLRMIRSQAMTARWSTLRSSHRSGS